MNEEKGGNLWVCNTLSEANGHADALSKDIDVSLKLARRWKKIQSRFKGGHHASKTFSELMDLFLRSAKRENRVSRLLAEAVKSLQDLLNRTEERLNYWGRRLNCIDIRVEAIVSNNLDMMDALRNVENTFRSSSSPLDWIFPWYSLWVYKQAAKATLRQVESRTVQAKARAYEASEPAVVIRPIQPDGRQYREFCFVAIRSEQIDSKDCDQIAGTIQALDEAEAIDLLRGQDLFVSEIWENKPQARQTFDGGFACAGVNRPS